MWPWEHAAVGYLLLSLSLRASGRTPPTTASVVALLVGTQLPDLVDKPLSWELGLFPSGYAVGHSAFVAVPLGLAVLGLAYRRGRGRRRLGAAFVVGYWSHLVADVLSPLRDGRGLVVSRVLWPVAEARPYGHDYGLRRGLIYVEEFVAGLHSMEPSSLLLLYVALPLLTLVLWIVDGSPGVSAVARAVDAIR